MNLLGNGLHPLAWQAADAEARAAQLRSLQLEVQEGLVAQARLRFAANRVQRAWLVFSHSQARQLRIERITALQVRGCVLLRSG